MTAFAKKIASSEMNEITLLIIPSEIAEQDEEKVDETNDKQMNKNVS